MGLERLIFWVISKLGNVQTKIGMVSKFWGFSAPIFYEANYSCEANIFDVEVMQ